MSVAAGRTRQRLSPEVRRTQLQDAAIDVVAEVGFWAASADAIARRAGVSKGLLWHYFADLDELMASAARRGLTVLEAESASSLDFDAALPELLRVAIRHAARLPSTHGRELRALREIGTNLRGSDGSPQLLRAIEYRQLYANQAALISRGQQAGSFRSDLDAHLLAVTYQGMVDVMLEHLDNNPELDPDAYADHVAAVLLDGIGCAAAG